MRAVRKGSIILIFLLGLLALLFSCDGDNGGTTGPTTLNISGTWDVTTTTTEGTCFPPGYTTTNTTVITQTGNNITFTIGNTTFTGTLVGDQLTAEGTWSRGSLSGRMTKIATVSSDGRSMSGTFDFEMRSGGSLVCSDRGTFTGTKR